MPLIEHSYFIISRRLKTTLHAFSNKQYFYKQHQTEIGSQIITFSSSSVKRSQEKKNILNEKQSKENKLIGRSYFFFLED